MTKDKGICIQCKKTGLQILKASLCNRCYYQKRNRERILEVVSFFRPKSEYNKEIFNIYIDKILSTYIKNQEPPVVTKFADLLEREAIAEIQRWEDIYSLSSKYAIMHSGANKEKRGCPFLKIKKELGVKHSLPNRKYYSIGSLERYISCFHQDDTVHVQKYADQLTKKYKLKVTTDSCVRDVLALYEYLRPLTLLKVNKQKLEKYFQYKKSERWNYGNHFYCLRMFYTWAKDQKLIELNPFEGLMAPSIKKYCQKCNKLKVFQNEGDICNVCLLMMKNADKVASISEDFKPKTNYNNYLLDLYLKYIKRYIITKYHIKIAEELKEYLEVRQIPTLKNWIDIKKISKEFKQYIGYSPKGNCPFIKIARMLQELKVLPIREEDYLIQYEAAVKRLPESFKEVIVNYFKILRKRKITLETCISYANLFNQFQRWLKSNYGTSNILYSSEPILINYFNQIRSEKRMINTMTLFRKFYKWAQREKYILLNPLECLVIPKIDQTMLICSNEQIKNIIKYIKSIDSDPEGAVILALMIYWGLTGAELRCSTIEIVNGLIQIQLYRKKLSYGRKNYQREEILILPDSPHWVKTLQKRFIVQWEDKYKKVKMDYPHQLLLFAKSLRSNRPISVTELCKRVYQATNDAVGEEIPPSVLRRTCGHIYSTTGEASILIDLGWSKNCASQFLWKQREYFCDTQKQ